MRKLPSSTSSAHFPQSNGFAEAMVKKVKKLMDHFTLQEKPWNFSLMEYRCTPIMGNISSPLELLSGQKPRTGLPSIPQGNSTTREYLKLSSISSRWIFLRKFPFQTMSQDREFGVLIHLTRYGSQP